MKPHDAFPKRPATRSRTLAAPRRLLAAVSLLGASLGVSAAAPTEQIGGPERAAEAGNPAMKVAKRKAWVRPGVSNQVKSNQVKSNQVKSNQVKSNQVKSDQVKSDQKKGMLPAVQSPEKK
jgi:DMSO/TMAO reductase YedYZ molybdopterin-dependent catalytic subunit